MSATNGTLHPSPQPPERSPMTHADLPATRNDFLLASLAKPGDTHTLPGQAP